MKRVNLPGAVDTEIRPPMLRTVFHTTSRPTPRPASFVSCSCVENPGAEDEADRGLAVERAGFLGGDRAAAHGRLLDLVGEETRPVVLKDHLDSIGRAGELELHRSGIGLAARHALCLVLDPVDDRVADELDGHCADRAEEVARHELEAADLESHFLAVLPGDSLGERLEPAGYILNRSLHEHAGDIHRLHGHGPAAHDRAHLCRRAQAIELVDELPHRLEVREQVVEPHEQRQEVVTGQLRAIPQLLQHVFERVRAVLDGDEPHRGRFALELVHLAEHLVDLLPEARIVARRDLEHGVDHLEGRVAVGEERYELARLDPQDPEQHVHLDRVARLRFLELAGQQHTRGDVVDRHQDLPRATVALHAMEVELEISDVVPALSAVEVDLNLRQRVDALDEILVDPLAPQQLDVLGRRLERLLGHELTEQVPEGQVVEIFAPHQRGKGGRVRLGDAKVAVDQEQAFLHRGQDIPGLALGLARNALVTRLEQLDVEQ